MYSGNMLTKTKVFEQECILIGLREKYQINRALKSSTARDYLLLFKIHTMKHGCDKHLVTMYKFFSHVRSLTTQINPV